MQVKPSQISQSCPPSFTMGFPVKCIVGCLISFNLQIPEPPEDPQAWLNKVPSHRKEAKTVLQLLAFECQHQVCSLKADGWCWPQVVPHHAGSRRGLHNRLKRRASPGSTNNPVRPVPVQNIIYWNKRFIKGIRHNSAAAWLGQQP